MFSALPNVFSTISKKNITTNSDDNPSTPTAHIHRRPSYVVTQDRRQELLEHARKDRILWITTNQDVHKDSTSTSLTDFHIAEDVLSFLETLGENDHVSMPKEMPNQEKDDYISILDEIKEKNYEQLDENNIKNNHLGGPQKEKQFFIVYSRFIKKLVHPSLTAVTEALQKFIRRFDDLDVQALSQLRDPQEQPGGILHAFISKLLQHPGIIYCFSDCVDIDEDLPYEVMESFLMEKLHSRTFLPFLMHSRMSERDRKLSERIQALGFIRFEHLDLKLSSTDQLDNRWTSLPLELQKLNLYLSPKRKMDCLLSVCKQLTMLLREQDKPLHRFPSADEFLPALIYVVLKSNPAALDSNVQYITQYRKPSKLMAEPGYFFTNFVSAIAFIESIDSSSLTITEEEFTRALKDAGCENSDAKESMPEHTSAKIKEPQWRFPSILEIREQRQKNRKIDINSFRFN